MNEIIHTPQSWCPRCRHSLNATSPTPGVTPSKAKPVEGDVTICGNCDAVLEFSAGMQLRAVTEGELAELPVDCRRAITRAKEFTRRLRGAKPS